MRKGKKYVLFNPGPVSITSRVRRSLGGDDLCHRESEFSELLQDVRKKILDVYKLDQNKYASVLLAGSSSTTQIRRLTTSSVAASGTTG